MTRARGLEASFYELLHSHTHTYTYMDRKVHMRAAFWRSKIKSACRAIHIDSSILRKRTWLVSMQLRVLVAERGWTTSNGGTHIHTHTHTHISTHILHPPSWTQSVSRWGGASLSSLQMFKSARQRLPTRWSGRGARAEEMCNVKSQNKISQSMTIQQSKIILISEIIGMNCKANWMQSACHTSSKGADNSVKQRGEAKRFYWSPNADERWWKKIPLQ